LRATTLGKCRWRSSDDVLTRIMKTNDNKEPITREKQLQAKTNYKREAITREKQLQSKGNDNDNDNDNDNIGPITRQKQVQEKP